MKTIETLILTNLLENEEYMRKVIPFLRDDYFSTFAERKVFDEINTFIDSYNKPPSREALTIIFQNKNDLKEEEYKKIINCIDDLGTKETNQDWLLTETEKFCRDKAVFNAVSRSIKILNGDDDKLNPDAIPSLLQDALGIAFDNSIGHDYMEDADARYEYYHRTEERIPFDLEMFNKITNGGLPKKTLSVCLAGVNVGKSLFMCHMASAALAQGKNVLYITMEMAEERIAERIDANLLNIPMNELAVVPKEMFMNRLEKIQKKTTGRLLIKEYPTGSAHSGHFRALLNDCRIKKAFVPDIIFIDYLNICSSSRFKMSNNVNSYTFVKAIAEELRGLAVEFDVPIMTATQVTRSGYCLDLNTKVTTHSGVKSISDVVVGDEVLSNTGWNTVNTIFPIVKKKMYRITTESGKEIVCSADHLFPTEDGEKNIKSGLCLQDKLFINKSDS